MRFLAVLSSLLLLVALAGCGKKAEQTQTKKGAEKAGEKKAGEKKAEEKKAEEKKPEEEAPKKKPNPLDLLPPRCAMLCR